MREWLRKLKIVISSLKKGELIPGKQGSKKEGKKEIHLYKLSKEEEKLLISLIDDIIGCVDDFKDGVLVDLLQINKIMKNLEIALKYVANLNIKTKN